MSDDGSSVRVPQQKRSEETRRKILDAGLILFERDGYHATSSKKIAREAGVSVGSFYSYFKDKKHLVLEIIEDKISMLLERSQRINDSPELRKVDERDLVRMMVFQARDLHVASPEFNREMHILCYTDEDVCQFMQEKNRRIDEAVIQLLRARKGCLRIHDLEAASHVVRGAIESFVHELLYFENPDEELVERQVEALVDMVHTYLFRPGCHVPEGSLD